MNYMYSLKDMPRLIAEWAESPEGQKSLKETAEKVRKKIAKDEQDARDFVEWYAKNKHKPMTI